MNEKESVADVSYDFHDNRIEDRPGDCKHNLHFLPPCVDFPALERMVLMIPMLKSKADLCHSLSVSLPNPGGLAIRWFMLRVIGNTRVIESESVNLLCFHLYIRAYLENIFKPYQSFFMSHWCPNDVTPHDVT